MIKDNILKLIQPYKVESKKIRLGPKHDGGYVLPEVLLTNSSCLCTYGVADDIEFEKEYCEKYLKKAYLFDHTINKAAWTQGLMEYIPEGLGFETSCKDFLAHHRELDMGQDVLLKIDIEGGEYDYFEKTDLESISQVTSGLMLEVHWIDKLGITPRFVDLLEALTKYYTLAHTHGNNYGSMWNCGGVDIPNVLELTFINKKYTLDSEKDSETYPIPRLDYPNNTSLPDLKLTFS